VSRVDYEKLSTDWLGETRATIRACVQAVRDIQTKRFQNDSSAVVYNADMRVGEARQFCKLQAEGQSLMQATMSQLNLSPWAFIVREV
jgi:magnesium chelatase family protein